MAADTDFIHVHPSLRGLSRVELEAMRIEGDIQRHGVRGFEFYYPIGMVPTPADRARSLAPLWLPGRVFVGETARWILRGGAAPDRVEIARRTSRIPHLQREQVRWYNRRIDRSRRQVIGDVEVSEVRLQR